MVALRKIGRPEGPRRSAGDLAAVVAADWSVQPKKRWAAMALRVGRGWRVDAPAPVGDVSDWLASLLALRARCGASVLVLLDFPVGVPASIARALRVDSYRELLHAVRTGRAPGFFTPSDEPAVGQPFFPMGSAAGVKKADFARRLGVDGPGALLRACDAAAGAECMFWAVGARQVAKAAASGAGSVVRPLSERADAALWPFDGTAAGLIGRPGGAVVAAEMYPAAMGRLLGLPRGSKTNAAWRAEQAAVLLDACARVGAEASDAFCAQAARGFGGDDAFDAAVGVVGALEVLRRGVPEPPDPVVRGVEGWIFGVGV